MIKHWLDMLSIWWLTRRYGQGYPWFGWVAKDGESLDLGIKRT
jgi:hypothetical protein